MWKREKRISRHRRKRLEYRLRKVTGNLPGAGGSGPEILFRCRDSNYNRRTVTGRVRIFENLHRAGGEVEAGLPVAFWDIKARTNLIRNVSRHTYTRGKQRHQRSAHYSYMRGRIPL